MTIKRRLEKLECNRDEGGPKLVGFRWDETPEEACARQGIPYSDELNFIGPVWIELPDKRQ
jgi:hypothetical protein